MIRGVEFSRARALGCACALAMAVAAGRMLHTIGQARLARSLAATLEEDRRALRIGRMSQYGDSSLEEARLREKAFLDKVGRTGGLGALLSGLPGNWDIDAGTATEHAGYRIQSCTLRFRAPSIGDWPAIIDAVGVLERSGTVSIGSFEMRTKGDKSMRSVDLVEITVDAAVPVKGDHS